MILIDDILISDEIIDEAFVCDLTKCKGACCVDGDAGAPLEKEELKYLEEMYAQVEPYLIPEGIEEIKKTGKFLYDQEFGWVTPTIANGMCAYGNVDKNGIVKCGIEEAYNDGKITWKKPISCHLFPIRIKKSRKGDLVNYEPREDLCSAACELGKQLKVPVYKFLKEPIIRKYGEAFYEALEATALHVQENK
ncbi:MAG: DUF3109 family protein [Ginsengibacter sp.]